MQGAKSSPRKIHLSMTILLPVDIQSLSHLQVAWLSLKSYICLLRCFLHDFIIIILFSYYMSENKQSFHWQWEKIQIDQKNVSFSVVKFFEFVCHYQPLYTSLSVGYNAIKKNILLVLKWCKVQLSSYNTFWSISIYMED